MGERRVDRLTVRADGELVRTSSTTPAPDEQERQRLGDQFEELLQDGARKNADRAEGQAAARPAMPARPPWRPGRDQASRARGQEEQKTTAEDDARRTAREQTAAARSRASGRDEGANEQSPEGAGAGSAHGKERAHEDHGSGQQSGGGGQDNSGALMAMQSDTLSPSAAAPAADTNLPEPALHQEVQEIANQVAARISAGRDHGDATVRIDLRDDLLPATSMTIEDRADAVVVDVGSGSKEASDLLAEHATDLGRAISRRTGRRTRIQLGEQSWTTEAEEGDAG